MMEKCLKPLACTAELKALIAEAGLDVSDLETAPGLVLLGCHGGTKGRELVGCVGLEVYGDVALLRSLVVAESMRGQGVGQQLLRGAEAYGLAHGVSRVFLLTITVAPFFERLGYRVFPRGDAPAAIAGTAQFSGLCPASSGFMCKTVVSGVW